MPESCRGRGRGKKSKMTSPPLSSGRETGPSPPLGRGTGPSPPLGRGTGPSPPLGRGTGPSPPLGRGTGPSPPLGRGKGPSPSCPRSTDFTTPDFTQTCLVPPVGPSPTPTPYTTFQTSGSSSPHLESNSGSMPPHTSQSGPHTPISDDSIPTSESRAQATSGVQGKEQLWPEGANGFYPSNKGTAPITRIIKRRMNEGFSSFGKVSQTEKDTWFNEWKKEVYWEPQHEAHMRKAFRAKASKRLSDMLSDVRKENKQPDWCGDVAWTSLQRYWETPKFKDISGKNNQNRASSAGGALHRGGSISVGTHAYKIEKETGKRPTPLEMFERFYMYPNNTFVSERSSQTHARIVEAVQSQPPGTVETYEDHVRICKDVLPPNKKGRRLGLNYLNESTSGMPASTSSDPIMQQKIDTLDRKVEDIGSQQQNLANMMQQMMMMMQQNYRPEQPTHGQGDDDGEYDDEYDNEY